MKADNTAQPQGQTPATIDFKESNKIDPTEGWIPFGLVIAIVPLFLAVIILVGYLIIS